MEIDLVNTPVIYHDYIFVEEDKIFLKISPQLYFSLLDEFTKILKKNIGREFKYIYGIPSGGVSIAQYISKHLGLRYITNIGDPEIIDHFLLIVDDIIESSRTLHNLTQKFPYATTAVIHRKPKMPDDQPAYYVEPTYFLHNIDPNIWVRYPYEPDNEIINR